MQVLVDAGYEVVPVMSPIAYSTDTRFGKAEDFRGQIEAICQNPIVHTIPQAEPFGPKKMVDAMIVAPCTGNTLGKLANGITDTPVTLAVKSTRVGGQHRDAAKPQAFLFCPHAAGRFCQEAHLDCGGLCPDSPRLRAGPSGQADSAHPGAGRRVKRTQKALRFSPEGLFVRNGN